MHSIAFWPTLIALAIAVATDLRSRRIPNWLVAPYLAGGLAVNTAIGGVAGAGRSLAGIALAAGVLGILCYLRGMGMGDLKLCAAVGAWIGPSQLVTALVVMGITGGILALGCAMWRGSLGRHLDGAGELAVSLGRGGLQPHATITLDNPGAAGIPYAVAIAAGTLFSFYAL